MGKRDATRIEVTERANPDYFAAVLGRRDKQIFFRGDVPPRPSPTLETMWDANHFPLRDDAFSNRRAAVK